MVLNFTPPQDLIDAYLNRPSPGQIASQGVNAALQTYAQQKSEHDKEKNEALQTLLKASDSVDLSDPATAKAFAPLYKNAGVDPSIFQPPTPSTGTAPGAGATPTPTAGTPDQSGTPITQAPPISPIIQASLNNPQHLARLTPDYIAKMSKTGYGRKVIDSQEKGTNILTKQTADQEKDALSKVPFEDVATTFGAANEKAVGDQLVADAKAKGLSYVDSKKMDYALKGLGVKNTGMRGGALDSMAATRELALRKSLNDDAAKALISQGGTGKDQMTVLNRIGRAEPLITQMLGQPGGGDPRQMRELANSLDRVIRGGGQTAQSQIEGLIPQTAQGKFASWKEWFTNNPSGTEQQAFIKRYADTLAREKGAVQGQFRNMAENTAPTLRILKQHYPEDYQAQLDSVLKNTQLVGEPDVPVVEDGYSYTPGPGGKANQSNWKKQ